MINGGLKQLQASSIPSQPNYIHHNYHAMTDVDGKFSIPLNCLSFGLEQAGYDEFANFTGDSWTIPYIAKLWVVHEGDAMFSTQPYVVEPEIGVYVEITTPY